MLPFPFTSTVTIAPEHRHEDSVTLRLASGTAVPGSPRQAGRCGWDVTALLPTRYILGVPYCKPVPEPRGGVGWWWIRDVWPSFQVCILFISGFLRKTQRLWSRVWESKELQAFQGSKMGEFICWGIRLLFESLTIKWTHRHQTDRGNASSKENGPQAGKTDVGLWVGRARSATEVQKKQVPARGHTQLRLSWRGRGSLAVSSLSQVGVWEVDASHCCCLRFSIIHA